MTLHDKVWEGHSECTKVASGVKPVSILRLVLFLLCMNGFINGMSCNVIKVIADMKLRWTVESLS